MRRLFFLPWTPLSYIVLFLQFILILYIFRDYGITWDEQWHSTYGEYIIRWYTSQFHDRSVLNYWIMPFYGGFFEVIAQCATRFSPFGPFETRHLIGALFGFIGVAGAFQLGKFMAGPVAGFLSALFLVLTPRFYGHSFFNSKDIPFAVLYLLSLYFIIKSVEFLPHVSRGMILKLSIVIGLSLGIRFGGVLLFGYYVFAFVLWLFVRQTPQSLSFATSKDVKAAVKTFVPRYFLVVIMAYCVALVWWPSAQVEPIRHPLKVLWQTSAYPWWMREVFFEGTLVPAVNLPWYYVPKWFLVTLPEFYLIGLPIGLGLVGLAVVRMDSIRKHERFIAYCVLLIAIVFPVAYGATSGAILYDAERHFLFVVPLLGVLAAVSVSSFLTQSRFEALRFIVLATIVGSFIATAAEMWSLHPYQYIYFNRLFGGGIKEAAKSFETDYWGSSYKEGVEWIVKNYRGRADRKIKVASCSSPLSTEYFLPKDRFEYVGSYDYPKKMTGHPDLFLATTRWNCHQTFNGGVVHIVERKGAPLLYVKEIAASAKPSRPY